MGVVAMGVVAMGHQYAMNQSKKHLPGAGLESHRRLCDVSQVKVWAPEVL